MLGDDQLTCRVCGTKTRSGKDLSRHIKKIHNINSRQYTVDYILGGIEPKCPVCGTTPRYVAFSFKKFCKEHSREASAAGGRVGGRAEAWNKGKTKDTDDRVKKQAESMASVLNPFYGKAHSVETKRKISQTKTLGSSSIEERVSLRAHEFELVTPLEDYWSRQQQYLDFKCKTCGTIQPKTLQAFERGSRCYKCFPESKSNWELEVFEFVKSMCSDAVSGDRTVLSPKEIDVFVPSLSVGFECHGLYWHSESSPKGEEFDKREHLNKLISAKKRGVKLYQFFEDEWRDKRKIVESIIKHRLHKSDVNIGARTLAVSEMSSSEQRSFFDSTHISGYVPAKFGVCLKSREGTIVAGLSVRSPRNTKKYGDVLEVARFSTLSGFNVIGGLNRLVSAVSAKAETCSRLMTYVDKRIGDGHGYLKCGFVEVSDTDIDFWYTDNVFRYDRFKFRSQHGKSEKEIANDSRVSRIYGCGSLVMTRDV